MYPNTTDVQNYRLLIVAIILFAILGAFFGGFAFGEKRTHQAAVDAGSGKYVMDKYGTVEWKWDNSSKMVASN